jgi:hypothetical protein
VLPRGGEWIASRNEIDDGANNNFLFAPAG